MKAEERCVVVLSLRRMKTLRSGSGIQKRGVVHNLRQHVLAALRAVPLDRTGLYHAVFNAQRGKARPRNVLRDEKFLDALALLRADGLISNSAHPLEERRLYYLTQKGAQHLSESRPQL